MVESEIVTRTPKALAVAIAVVVLSVFSIGAMQFVGELSPLDGIAESHREQMAELSLQFKVVTIVGGVPLSLLAALYGYVGVRILRSGLFPPKGMGWPWTIKRVNGGRALAVGICFLVLAILFLVYVGVGMWHWPSWV